MSCRSREDERRNSCGRSTAAIRHTGSIWNTPLQPGCQRHGGASAREQQRQSELARSQQVAHSGTQKPTADCLRWPRSDRATQWFPLTHAAPHVSGGPFVNGKTALQTAIAAVIVTVAITVPVSIVTTTNNLQGSTSALSDGEALCNSARPSAPARAATNKELGTVSSPRYLIRNANALYTGCTSDESRAVGPATSSTASHDSYRTGPRESGPAHVCVGGTERPQTACCTTPTLSLPTAPSSRSASALWIPPPA